MNPTQVIMKHIEETRAAFIVDPNPETATEALLAVGLEVVDDHTVVLMDGEQPVTEEKLQRLSAEYRYAWAIVRASLEGRHHWAGVGLHYRGVSIRVTAPTAKQAWDVAGVLDRLDEIASAMAMGGIDSDATRNECVYWILDGETVEQQRAQCPS